MPIVHISEVKEDETLSNASLDSASPKSHLPKKGQFFSSMSARVLFFLLLLGDIAWTLWICCKLGIGISLFLITFGKLQSCKNQLRKSWVSLKRASVCGISLIIALFSPALGIMVASTYFLMYDRLGIEEVVPTSLQDQFQEFFKESNYTGSQ